MKKYIVSALFLEELQANGSQSLLLLDMLLSGELSKDSEEFKHRRRNLNEQNRELYRAWVATVEQSAVSS